MSNVNETQTIKVELPLSSEVAVTLTVGTQVELSGTVYTARDLAHRRLAAAVESGAELPFDLQGATIYYAGPAPAPPGKSIGSIGPTTASRMDPFTPLLLKSGLTGMIGKGPRSPEVQRAIAENNAVYFVAVGGAAAYLSQFVVSAEIVAWPELGPEAIRRLEIRDFPATVAIDASGQNLFNFNI